MKTFRGKEVIGWKVVSGKNAKDLEDKINKLMDGYNFEDFQFTSGPTFLYAAILISDKE